MLSAPKTWLTTSNSIHFPQRVQTQHTQIRSKRVYAFSHPTFSLRKQSIRAKDLADKQEAYIGVYVYAYIYEKSARLSLYYTQSPQRVARKLSAAFRRLAIHIWGGFGW